MNLVKEEAQLTFSVMQKQLLHHRWTPVWQPGKFIRHIHNVRMAYADRLYAKTAGACSNSSRLRMHAGAALLQPVKSNRKR
jgi:hypothetical protein